MLFNSQLLKCPVAELVRSVACKDCLYFMIIQNCLVCFLKAAKMRTNCTSEPIPHDITAHTSRCFTVLGRARPANLGAAIIVAMRGRSEVRGSDLRPAVALQKPASLDSFVQICTSETARTQHAWVALGDLKDL